MYDADITVKIVIFSWFHALHTQVTNNFLVISQLPLK